MAPVSLTMSSPSRRTSGFGSPTSSYGGSPTSRRFSRRNSDDPNQVVMDPNGHKEKLPRPMGDVSAEAVYRFTDAGDSCSSPNRSSPSRTKSFFMQSDAGKNASRKFLWTTTQSVMLRPSEVASNLPIPLAALCTPFADMADDTVVPLSDLGSQEPLRCTRCRSYVNAHWKWCAKEAGRIQCNMCGHKVEASAEFVEDMDRCGHCADAENHPELVFGSVDFTAPAGYDDSEKLRSPPVAIFVVETSPYAICSGFAASTLQAIEQLLELEEDTEEEGSTFVRRIALVTFGSAVQFFTRYRSGRFHSVGMHDVEEPYVPVCPESMLTDMRDDSQLDHFRNLLRRFRDELAEQVHVVAANVAQATHGVAGGPALRASVEAAGRCGGGDVLMFHASAFTLGVGSQLPSLGAVPDTGAPTAKRRGGPSRFQEEMLSLCRRGGVAVSSTAAPAAAAPPLDAKALQWLPWHTGGDVMQFPAFTTECQQQLTDQLRHWAARMQRSAYDCVMRLRCSKGLTSRTLLAPWCASSKADSAEQSAFEIPRLAPDASVAFTLLPEYEDDTEDEYYTRRDDRRRQLFVQVVVLYTNSCGERLLRTHTTAINVVTSVRLMYSSVSVAPLITLLMKQAVSVALNGKSDSNPLLRDTLLEPCLRIMAHYRRHCFGTDNTRVVVLSQSTSLLPLYVLSARKFLYALLQGQRDQGDLEEQLRRILGMPVHCVMAALYPRLYPLCPDDIEEHYPLPEPYVTSADQLGLCPSGAFVVTNGFGAWLLRLDPGQDAHVESWNIEESAKAVAGKLRVALEPSPAWSSLSRLPGIPEYFGGGNGELSWRDKVFLSTIFVEDEGAAGMAYEQWLQFLQEQLLRLSG